jgi:anti-sigma factor RsiW
MNDCPNADIRDLLCDHVHGTLAEAERRRVDAHVAGCVDCTSELELLGRARTALRRTTPRIDRARIASAIAPRSARPMLRFSNWRVAATIAVMAVGAASLSLARREGPITTATIDTAGQTAVGEAHALSFSGRLSTLDDADLEQLLAEIDDFDGGTPAEPAAVLPVPAWEGGTP